MTRDARSVRIDALFGAALGLLALGGASCRWANLESSYRQAVQIRYVRDEGGDYWQSPAETAARGAGDCEDKALYLHDLLRRRGIASEVVFGIQKLASAKTAHAWVQCHADGKLYVLDPSGRRLGARSDLPASWFYPLRDIATVRAKLSAYLERTGESGINSHYEAAIAAEAARVGGGGAPPRAAGAEPEWK